MKKTLLICSLTLIINIFLFAENNPYTAPLYWSPYEHHIVKEQAGISDNYLLENELIANVDWVEAHLKELGYDMICMDGWGDVMQVNENGYRSSHSINWSHDFAWWSAELQNRNMTLGMYGNPLWIHVDKEDTLSKIVGTDILVSSLIDPDEDALWFTWVQVDRPGAEEYVKGYINYYAEMGIPYFRIDFLSWFENGWDRYLGTVGPDRTREHYETALRWMREAADSCGMFLSLVMPHLYQMAEAEKNYGHMFRINEDVGDGAWFKWSEKDQGILREGWSAYANPFDGLIYWSQLSGRDSVILDPDFLRINTFANNDEKKSVISLCFMAGAPITISDQYSTIGTDLWYYQNKELLDLRKDGFVGKPLSHDPNDPDSQIWTGQMQDGSWVVALFNRENSEQTRDIVFSSLGMGGAANIRDLWLHENLTPSPYFSAIIPAHGCRVLKVVSSGFALEGPNAIFVDSLSTALNGSDQAIASVLIRDSNGDPIDGATVYVKFDTPFSETISGVTGNDGITTIRSSNSNASVHHVNASVISVSHPDHVYTADLNTITSISKHFFVGGTFSDWSLQAMDYENGWWVIDSLIIREGSHELKFADTPDFSGDDWGNSIGLSGTAKLTTGGDPNITFDIDPGGFHSIRFNEISLEYNISHDGIYRFHDAMYLGGSFNSWQLTPMTFDGENWIYEDLQLNPGSYELKFANTSDWSEEDWGNASGLSGYASNSTGGDPNLDFVISESGTYTITFNDITFRYSIEASSGSAISENPTFQIYPNPSQNRFTLDPGNQLPMEVKLYNLRGQLLKELNIGQKTDIDLSRLPTGYYLLQTNDLHGNVNVYKIIKNK